MRAFGIAVLAMVTSGCATPRTWSHDTKNQQDFYRDNSQCMAMAGSGQATPIVANSTPFAQGYNQGIAIQAQANQRTIYEHCMLGNGWGLLRQDDDCRADQRVFVGGKWRCK